MEAIIPLEDEDIKPHLDIRQFKRGEFLFRAGNIVSDLFILKSGNCELIQHIPNSEDIIRVIKTPGECIGCASYVAQTPSLFSVRATDNCILYTLSHTILQGLMLLKPDKAELILRPIASYICKVIRQSIDSIRSETLIYPSLCQHQAFFTDRHMPFPQADAIDMMSNTFIGDNVFSETRLGSDRNYTPPFYHLKKNQILYQCGDTDKIVYIVISGTLQTFLLEDEVVSKMTTTPPGGEVGLVSLLDNLPSPTGCVAREDSVIAKISQAYLINEIKDKDPNLYQQINLHFMKSVSNTFNRFFMHYSSMKALGVLLYTEDNDV